MSKKHQLAMQPSANVDMNPMLDIVFILLIFFIVTASFSKEPVLDISKQDKAARSLTPTLTPQINIDDKNQIFLNGRQIDVDAIAINIARVAAKGEITSIGLKAHAQSEHNTLVQVLDAVKSQTSAPVSLASI
ncbi:biopolymer transporter ExbD [Pseudoalteromonas luteoviolacea]|uniref:ExbD/TolR family protein n=1 Tax=Pseudoalteromonas luteoviolacea TaxID=43657 RepID=UPI001B35AA68|nr:biopolymer transporter ExbD [Pseudoalteromonas luteoviolacea]MBQ4811823.1 biopolymer transporter ExbD [Pseudoalteromonas luteoviolacea]